MSGTPGTYDAGSVDDTYDARADDLAVNKRLIARYRQADQPQTDLHDAWLDFGRHNWVWQLLHRKPRSGEAR